MTTTNNNASIKDFEAWSGAVSTKNKIIEEGKADDFDMLIEDLYPIGIDETQLNDLLWFENDFIYESLNINIDE